MDLLGEVLSPEVLHARVPRLAETAEARQQHRNRLETISKLGAFGRTGFTNDRNMQYVATIDQAVWSAVLDVFARIDPDSGEPMDDGLLYKTDARGNVVINKDFFYALLSGPLKDYDMRGKVTLM